MNEPATPRPEQGPAKKPAQPAQTARPEASDAKPGSSPGGSSAAASATPAASDFPPKRRRWRRRLVITGAVVIGLVIVARVALWLSLPTILDRTARAYGFSCTYEDLGLSMLTGDLEVWHLTLTPVGGGEPVMEAEYCLGDVLVRALFTGNLVVRRLEVDGIDFLIDRAEDGSFPAFQGVIDAVAAMRAASPEDEPVEEPVEIDLTVPFQLDALRLQHCQILLRDASLDPPAETRLDVNVRVSDVGSTDRRTRFQLTLASPDVLGRLVVEGYASSSAEGLDVEMSVRARDLQPVRRAVYLEAIGLTPVARVFSFELDGRVALSPAAAPPADGAAGGEETARDGDTGSEDARSPTLAGRVELSGTALSTDGEEQLALDRLEIDVAALDPGQLRVARVLLEGGRVLGRRLPSGAPLVAGMTTVVSPSVSESTPERSATPVAATARAQVAEPPGAAANGRSAVPSPATGFAFSIDEVTLRDFHAVLRDAVVAADHAQSFDLEELTLTDITSAEDGGPLRVRGTFAAPGIVESVVVDGSATPIAAEKKSVDLKVAARGVTASAAAPYLAALELEPVLESGRFDCVLHADIAGGGASPIALNLSAREIVLAEAGEIFALEGASISGVEVAPDLSRVVVDAIEIAGPRFALARRATNAIEAGGLRWNGLVASAPGLAAPAPRVARPRLEEVGLAKASARVETEAAPATSAREAGTANSAGALSTLPAIEVRRLSWKGSSIGFLDEAIEPVSRIDLTDFGLELENVVFEPRGSAGEPATGRLRAWLAAPGIVDRLEMSGDVAQSERGVRAALDLTGSGVTGRSVAPYLRLLGLEPVLPGGRLRARLEGEARATESGVSLSALVADAALEDDTGAHLALGRAALNDLSIEPGEVRVASIEIVEPSAAASRSADGDILVAGLRLLPPPESAADGDEKEGGGGAGEPAASPPTAIDADAEATPPSVPSLVAVLESFTLAGASLAWRDEAVAPAVDTALIVDASLAGLTIGREAPAATFDYGVKIPGSLESLSGNGSILLASGLQRLTADLDVRGLTAGPLAVYSPPGTRLTLEDGRAASGMLLEIAEHEGGGQRARFEVERTFFQDGADGAPLFALEGVRVAVARLDLAGGVIDVDEISVSGVDVAVERSAEGELRAFGVGIDLAGGASGETASSAPPRGEVAADGEATSVALPLDVAGPPEPDATETAAMTSSEVTPIAEPSAPHIAEAAAEVNDAASVGVSAGAAEEPARTPAPASIERNLPITVPEVRLGTLDLHLASFTVTDLARAESRPLAMRDFRLRSLEEILLLGKDPGEQPPARLELTGRVDPLFDAITVETSLTPFASIPEVKGAVEIRGLRGSGLTELVPELAELVDGSQLEDGRFGGEMELRLLMKRRHALDLARSEGFGFELTVGDVRFQNGTEGRVLAGFDRLEVDAPRIDPASGGFHVKRIELAKPQGYVARRADGIHILDLVIADPTAAASAEDASDAAASGDAATVEANEEPDPDADGSTDTAPAVTEAPAEEGPELRLDELFVSGIDFTFVDETVDPIMHFPLSDLDVSVRGLTNRALLEASPVRFSVIANAAGVPLPSRRGEPGAIEERPLFEEAAASGRLVFYPAIKGWTKLALGGLQLANFEGSAAQHGVELHDGVLDFALDLRMLGDGVALADSRIVFTDLRIAEPPDGPISRYLKLPAPLDAVIFVLRDEDGAIGIPLDFDLTSEGISVGQIARAGVTALSSVIASAVAASPFRVAGALGSLVTGEEEEVVEEPLLLDFEPGGSALSLASERELAPLLERLRDDEELVVTLRHELGALDVPVARLRSNPSREDCEAILARLTERRFELLNQRRALVAETRAAYAIGNDERSSAGTQRLRALDSELGSTEQALDRILELFRRGAERRGDRRTRDACVALGAVRLQQVRRFLLESDVPDIGLRLQLVRPRYAEPGELQYGQVSLALRARKGP